MEESSDSDSYYVDLPSSLTLSLPKHMHLLTYDELCFGRYNFDSFKMQVTPTLAPFVYGLEVQSLSAKMTSVMEEGDEDQMEDETELVRTLHGKNRIGSIIRSFSDGSIIGSLSISPPIGKGSSNSRSRSLSAAGPSWPNPGKQLGKDERGCGNR